MSPYSPLSAWKRIKSLKCGSPAKKVLGSSSSSATCGFQTTNFIRRSNMSTPCSMFSNVTRITSPLQLGGALLDDLFQLNGCVSALSEPHVCGQHRQPVNPRQEITGLLGD